MHTAIKLILEELKEALKALYGKRLKGVYLYGSYARGSEGEGSDIDVALVLEDLGRYSAEIDRTSEIVSELSLKYGVSISRVFISRRDWSGGKTGFLLNVRGEAVPV